MSIDEGRISASSCLTEVWARFSRFLVSSANQRSTWLIREAALSRQSSVRSYNETNLRSR